MRVEITNGNKVLSTNKYETYAVFKIYQLISYSLYKSKDFKKSFYYVIYNLILISIAINKHIQIAYIRYQKIDFYLINIYCYKLEKIIYLKKRIKVIEIRYNGKVIFIRSNTEPALGREFDKFFIKLDIIQKRLAPNTFKQNDYLEYLDYILVIKTRVIIIILGIPRYLQLQIF